MALVRCAECNGSVSDLATHCPSCGGPLAGLGTMSSARIRAALSVIPTSETERRKLLLVELQQRTHAGDPVAQGVSITDFNMPFGSMVSFMIKWAIAAIPAALILAAVGFMVSVLFAGCFAALLKH